MDIRRFAWAAGACAFGCSFPAVSQQPPAFPGGETIVTATRLPQPLGDVLRNATVITAEDIARSGQLTLAELLRTLGGVEIAATGGHGQPAAVFMRGANAAHTLVLVDGIRMQSASVGTAAFENIPLSEIERIEIVPGPVSSLYGADAIGGVIQVFTRSGSAPRMEASVGVGTERTGVLRGAISGSRGDTQYAFSAGLYRTDGYNVTRPSISFGRFHADDDPYRNASFSARLTQRLAQGHEVGASLFHSRGETHFDNGPDTRPRTEQDLATYAVHLRNRFGAWESLARLGASRDDSSTLDDPFGGDFRTEQLQATWQNTFHLGDGLTLLAGYEHLVQEVDASTVYAVNRRKIDALFAGVTAERGSHALQASVRRDDNSQFGAPTTGSLAYGFRLSPRWRLRAGYGTAFHAPSFNELYFPGFGNDALAPERSRNREAGLDFEAGGQKVTATCFDNRIRGLIVFVFDPITFSGRPENVEQARIRGTELGYRGAFGATEVRARLTLQDPESLPSGLQLQRRARRHGSVAVTHAAGAWRAGVEVSASGERFDSATEAPATRMAGYAVVNLTLAREIARDWSAELRWNNVADRDYELAQGFRPPGANVLLSLRWQPRR